MNTTTTFRLFFAGFLFINSAILGQSSQETFGKNRIQYQNFQWSTISTDNFDIYYYPQSKPDAIIAAKYAEFEFDRLTDLLGYAPYSRIKLIVYATHSDLMQSNIGLTSQQVFIGGYTVFLKNKVEVAFNGIQTDFRKEIGRGISQMILNEMLYGGNVKEVLQSTYFMSLPEWFLSGLVSYLTEGWSIEMDDKIRDLFLSKKFRKPNHFTKDDAAIAGHSVWNYLAERYGKSTIGNILNSVRYTRNYETSIAEVVSTPYSTVIKDWRVFYKEMNKTLADTLARVSKDKLIIKHTRDEARYSSIRLSPDGSRLVYVQNWRGRYKVIVKNLKTNKRYTVYRGGYRTFDQKIDYDMPVVAWRNNDKVGVISIKQDKMMLVTYDIKNEIENYQERMRLEVSNFFNIRYSKKQTYRGIYKHFKQVNDFSFSEDGATLVISGENILGQSDIFIYNLRNNNIKQITNDIYDDMHPVFLPKTIKSFVFNSNRLTDTLSPVNKGDYRKLKNNHNIFLYDEDKSTKLAQRLTDSDYNETSPKLNKNGDIYYLSDENGINGLYKLSKSDRESMAVTNYRQNFLSYDINNRNSSLAFIMEDNGKRRIFLDTNFKNHPSFPQLPKTQRQTMYDNMVVNYSDYQSTAPIIVNKMPVVTLTELLQKRKPSALALDSSDIDVDNYIFEFEKATITRKKNGRKLDSLAAKSADTSKSGPGYVMKKKVIDVKIKHNEIYISSPVKYRNDFGIDNVTTSLRIDPLRGLGIQGAMNMSDLMGNHRFNAGLFGSFDFKTSIMWGEYEYLKKRVDYKIKFTKDVLYWSPSTAIHRYSLYKLEATASYPINPMMRISATPFYAYSKFTNMFVGPNFVDKSTDYLGGNIEYIFDNSRSLGVNVNEGSRIKLGITYYYSPFDNQKNFGKMYADIRNYTRVHREVIWANRLTAGTFFDSNRNNFLLGGMDNWMFNSTDIDNANHPLNTNINEDNRNLLFMEYATNLRGYKYSAQYGNNFILFNSELRVPIFKYLIRRQISSNFIRNLIIAGFYDVGVAWSGANPLSTDNSVNTKVINQSPFRAIVTNYNNPFLAGYGFGLRSMVFGYYTKLDFAWGIQDYVRQPLKVYLTFGYDF